VHLMCTEPVTRLAHPNLLDQWRTSVTLVRRLFYCQSYESNGATAKEVAMKRYFEFVHTKSSKFWEVWIDGPKLFTRFGKIGASGQTTTKDFPSPDQATIAMQKAIGGKTKKGYVETSKDGDSRGLASASSTAVDSSDLDPEVASLVARLVTDYAAFLGRYGPLESLDEEDVDHVDPALVWSEVEGSEYIALVNGYADHDDCTGWYYQASQPFDGDQLLLFTTVAYLGCEYCEDDPDECTGCQGSGTVALEIEEIVARSKTDIGSAAEIWSQRVPGGTLDRIQLPIDYEQWPDLPRPPWLA